MSDGRTIDIGHVHTPIVHGGPCAPTCPHPDHDGCTCSPYWPKGHPNYLCTCGSNQQGTTDDSK